MLSATTPAIRKDSAQSSEDGVKAGLSGQTESSLVETSTLLYSANNAVTGGLDLTLAADVVTNDERAKSSSITRVLSPMRPRRTPVLVNAPDVRWRLGLRLRHMSSLESVLSSSTTSVSEASTVPPTPISPHNVALPSSVASSSVSFMPEETASIASPPPPRPKPTQASVNTRYNETIERLRQGQVHYFHQPHPLSPVTEASSSFSVGSLSSSIVDLDIQEIATAERHDLTTLTRCNALRTSPAHHSQVSLGSQASRQSRFRERFSIDGEEHYANSLQNGGHNSTQVPGELKMGDKGVSETEKQYDQLQRQKQERRAKTICGRLEKCKKKVAGFGQRIGNRIARNFGAWVLARGLGADEPST
ncbi:hypothetical protein EJ07DRAFT_174227 [Lizonia empirigonia]|nr:hypothetical protein EJ07DRAFT_174227 [Lizonia empirigonia]